VTSLTDGFAFNPISRTNAEPCESELAREEASLISENLQTCKRRSNRDRIALKSHHFSALIAGGTPANISSLARNTESPVCNSLKQGFRV
jgi:hypothetical protein